MTTCVTATSKSTRGRGQGRGRTLALIVLILTICTSTSTSTSSGEPLPRGDDSVADKGKISNLQLYHRMPVVAPLDEPFSNIPSEAFTIDTNLDSKRTLKKDLTLDLVSEYGPPSEDNLDGNFHNLDIGDLLKAFFVLENGEESDKSDQSVDTLEWFTPADDSDVATVPVDYTQKHHIKSIYLNQNQKPKQLYKQIMDSFKKELGPQHEPITPFVNRAIYKKPKSNENNVHYGTDGSHDHHTYNGLDQYGYRSGSNVKRYDSNKQHYYGSDKVHDSNKQTNNGLKRVKYDSDKVYYGHNKHHGTNKVHDGPHYHYDYDSNKGDLDSTKNGHGSINENYGLNKQQLPRLKLAIWKGRSASNKKAPADKAPGVEGPPKWDVSLVRADSLCRRIYQDPVEAAFCTGLLSRDLAEAEGAGAGLGGGAGGRRGHNWLVLGEGKDQSGHLPLVV